MLEGHCFFVSVVYENLPCASWKAVGHSLVECRKSQPKKPTSEVSDGSKQKDSKQVYRTVNKASPVWKAHSGHNVSNNNPTATADSGPAEIRDKTFPSIGTGNRSLDPMQLEVSRSSFFSVWVQSKPFLSSETPLLKSFFGQTHSLTRWVGLRLKDQSIATRRLTSLPSS